MTDDQTHNEITGGFFFSAVIQGRDITVQLPAQVHTALDGLPAPSGAFVGRDTDLELVLGLLNPVGSETGVVQVSAVAGLGGVGKTELALQAAHAALARGWFPGGVLFVDLFGYDLQRKVAPATALDGMLRAAGIPGEHIPTEVQDRSRLFSSVIAAYATQGRDVLVVIDNASSSAQARPLLPSAGRAIVTSRHSLADLDARLLELDILTPAASIELLAKQLHLTRGAADTRVAADPDNALSIAHLCAGLPLALRIVAALLATSPHRSLAAMAIDLENTQTRLDELHYAQGDDERAVRAAFDLSYRHLNPGEARMFRLLTINPGPDVSTEATTVITGLNRRKVRKTLEELARAHLIEHGAIDGRWRMHDLVRLYAEEQGQIPSTAAADRRRQALTALLEYYLATARAAIRHLDPTDRHPTTGQFPGREEALAWLDTEYPNLNAAVHTAATNGTHHTIARDLPHTLWNFLSLRRYFTHWITLTTHGLHAARHLGDRHGEARALNNLGIALDGTRRFEEAIIAYQDAAAIYRDLGDQDGEGMVLNNLAATLSGVERFEEAVTACQNSAAIYRDLGDQHGEGRALASLASILRRCGRSEEAVTASQDAARIFRDLGDQHGQGLTLTNLGLDLIVLSRFEEAVTACQSSAAIYRDLGDQHSQSVALDVLGLALGGMDRFEEAVTASQDAARIFRDLGDQHSQGGAMNRLGLALRRAGRLQEAIIAYQDAARIFRDLGDQDNEDNARRELAATQHAQRFARLGKLTRWWPFRRRSVENTD